MKMEKIAYTILSIIALAFFICLLAGLIAAFPYGIVGLLLIIAFGLLFIKGYWQDESRPPMACFL